jgi:hypothetical protein
VASRAPFPRRVFGEAFNGLCCAWGGATKVIEYHNLYCVMLDVDSVVIVSFFGFDPALSRIVAECVPWDGSPLSSQRGAVEGCRV